MKVLHIINSLQTGGAEKLIVDTLPFLKKTGLDVELLLLQKADSPFVTHLKNKSKDLKIISLEMNNVYNPSTILKIRKHLKNYDVVHVHLFPAQYFAAIARVGLNKKPGLVFTEHSTSNKRLKSKFFSVIDKRIYHYYDKIICISDEIREIIHHHTGISYSRLPVVENGVDLEAVRSAVPAQLSDISSLISPDDKLIIQVAAFRPGKDQATLIKSLQHLDKNVKLLLAGDGTEKQKNIDLVNQLGLQERVFFLGVRMDVPQLLKGSDIVVLSSEYEGLSLASIEGMYSGRPFIASDVKGLREVVKDAGILFPLGDDIALAQEIDRLLKDKHYYNHIVQKCELRAEKYSIEKMARKLTDIYKSLV